MSFTFRVSCLAWVSEHNRIVAVEELRKILDHRAAHARELAELDRLRHLGAKVERRIQELHDLLKDPELAARTVQAHWRGAFLRISLARLTGEGQSPIATERFRTDNTKADAISLTPRSVEKKTTTIPPLLPIEYARLARKGRPASIAGTVSPSNMSAINVTDSDSAVDKRLARVEEQLSEVLELLNQQSLPQHQSKGRIQRGVPLRRFKSVDQELEFYG